MLTFFRTTSCITLRQTVFSLLGDFCASKSIGCENALLIKWLVVMCCTSAALGAAMMCYRLSYPRRLPHCVRLFTSSVLLVLCTVEAGFSHGGIPVLDNGVPSRQNSPLITGLLYTAIAYSLWKCPIMVMPFATFRETELPREGCTAAILQWA